MKHAVNEPYFNSFLSIDVWYVCVCVLTLRSSFPFSSYASTRTDAVFTTINVQVVRRKMYYIFFYYIFLLHKLHIEFIDFSLFYHTISRTDLNGCLLFQLCERKKEKMSERNKEETNNLKD